MVDVDRADRGVPDWLVTRRYRPADAPAVADLTNLADRQAGASGGLTTDEMATFMRLRVADHETDSRLLVAADGTLVASGVVPTPSSDSEPAVLYGVVHPDWRGHVPAASGS